MEILTIKFEINFKDVAQYWKTNLNNFAVFLLMFSFFLQLIQTQINNSLIIN